MKIINEALLDEFRLKPCEWCGAAPPSDPHHVFSRGFGGGSRLDIEFNLASLCRECHTFFHSSKYRRESILAWVAARHGLTKEQLIGEINRIRRLPKDASPESIRSSPPPGERADHQQHRLPPDQPPPPHGGGNGGMETDEDGWCKL